MILLRNYSKMFVDTINQDFGSRAAIVGSVPKYNSSISDLENAETITKYFEGSYSTDRRDSGNWSSGVAYKGTFIGSKNGVGAPALIKYLGYIPTAKYMENLPIDVYNNISEKNYWIPGGCDRLPKGINVQVYDHGWNRGMENGIKVLERALDMKSQDVKGVYNNFLKSLLDIKVQTVGLPSLIAKVKTEQLLDYKTLYNYNIYGDGWNERTMERHDFALSMIVKG